MIPANPRRPATRTTCLLSALALASCTASLDRTIRAEWAVPRIATSIPMEVLESNHIFIRGNVCERSTSMLIDSAAGITVLDRQFAYELGLRPIRRTTVEGVSGSQSAHYVRVPSIHAGDLILRDLVAVVVDLMPIAARIGHPIPVILGRGFFRSSIVEIDYPAARLAFHPREAFRYDGAGRAVKLRMTRSGLRTVQCRIETQPAAWFQLDTGSGKTVSVFEAYTAKHALLDGRTPRSLRIGGGVGGFETERVASLKTFEFATFALRDVPASFPTPAKGAFAGKPYAGNLGGGVLRRFHLWIDFGGNRMYVEPGPDVADPFPRDRLGLITLVRGDALVVELASPGSPAAKAGLSKGTRLIRVGGRRGDARELRRRLNDLARQPDGATVHLTDSTGRDYAITLATHY